MTDEEIFDIAELYGWMDDFGRWNFQPDRLVSFALEVLRVNAEKPIYVDSSRFTKDQLDHKPGMVITEPVHAIDMSEKNVRVSDKWVEMQCQCGHKMYAKYTGREWVGLTNDEVNEFAAGCHLGNSVQGAIYKAAARLKEKNT
jgi:hypothetical protein